MIKGPELFTGMDILPPKNIGVKEPEFMTKVIAKLRFESLANDSDDSLFGYTDVWTDNSMTAAGRETCQF